LETTLPKEEKRVEYTLGPEVTPFKSPFEKEKKVAKSTEDIKLPEMVFQGMIWNSDRPQAIIDNRVYDINDAVQIGTGELKDEVKIMDITRGGIYLRYKEKDFVVRPK